MVLESSRRQKARAAVAGGLLPPSRGSTGEPAARRDGLAAFVYGLLLIYRPLRALIPAWALRLLLLPGPRLSSPLIRGRPRGELQPLRRPPSPQPAARMVLHWDLTGAV